MTQNRPKTLGSRLQEVRDLRGMSLRAVAEPAGISPAYVQKLERDEVESPSPHALYGLAEVLDTPYTELMGLAGYVVPEHPTGTRRPMLIAGEHSSEPLDREEADELARYLAFIRHERRRAQP